jgi:hypothetical protein
VIEKREGVPMNSTRFAVFLFLPTVLFAYSVLATFYGARRAYFAISWIPLAFFLVVYSLGQLLLFQHEADNWATRFLPAVAWISLIQALFGVALAIAAHWKKQETAGLLMAAALAGLPFFLPFWR